MNEIKIVNLSPIHIGTGNNLNKGIDYETIVIERKEKPKIVKQTIKTNKGDIEFKALNIINNEKLLNLVINDPKLRNSDLLNPNVTKLMQYYNIRVKDVLKYQLFCSTEAIKNEIMEQIKNINNLPYIPGSSIKGAIRSVIFWQYLRQNKSILENLRNELFSANSKNYAEKIIDKYIKKCFGKDSYSDFMRLFIVGDSKTFDRLSLRVYNVKVITLKFRNTNELFKDTLDLFPECIATGYKSRFRLKIDPPNEKICNNIKNFDTIEKIFKYCNEYAKDFAESEIQYLEKAGLGKPGPNQTKTKVYKFYEQIIEKAKANISNNNKKAILHLGWGIGWKGTTGNWLNPSPEKIWELFKKLSIMPFKHARSRDKYYPKSKRVVCLNGDYISTPGWLEMEYL